MRAESAPIATARRARSALQAVTAPARLNAARGRGARWCKRFGDINIGSVQTDDEWQGGSCERGGDPAGNNPVTVHDGGVMPPCDLAGNPPSLRERERRGDARGSAQ